MTAFEKWTRNVQETRYVATLSEDNIHEIAQSVGGSVHYGDGSPYLLQKGEGDVEFPWKIRVGTQLFSNESGGFLINGNGFNSEGDWSREDEDSLAVFIMDRVTRVVAFQVPTLAPKVDAVIDGVPTTFERVDDPETGEFLCYAPLRMHGVDVVRHSGTEVPPIRELRT